MDRKVSVRVFQLVYSLPTIVQDKNKKESGEKK